MIIINSIQFIRCSQIIFSINSIRKASIPAMSSPNYAAQAPVPNPKQPPPKMSDYVGQPPIDWLGAPVAQPPMSQPKAPPAGFSYSQQDKREVALQPIDPAQSIVAAAKDSQRRARSAHRLSIEAAPPPPPKPEGLYTPGKGSLIYGGPQAEAFGCQRGARKGPAIPMSPSVPPAAMDMRPLEFYSEQEILTCSVFARNLPTHLSEWELLMIFNTVGGGYPVLSCCVTAVNFHYIINQEKAYPDVEKIGNGCALFLYSNVYLAQYASQTLDRLEVAGCRIRVRASSLPMDFKRSKEKFFLGQTRAGKRLWLCPDGAMDPRGL